jgi:hypothetical protein
MMADWIVCAEPRFSIVERHIIFNNNRTDQGF